MIIHRFATCALAAALVSFLTMGCAPQAEAPAPTPSTEDRAEPETETVVQALTRPASAFGVGCESLLPTAQLNETIGRQTAPVDFSLIGPQKYSAQGAALANDGALLCTWDAERHDASGLMIALPDAAVGFDRSAPAFIDYAAAYTPVTLRGASSALAYCTDSYEPDGTRCSWSVKVGDTWVFASFADVPATDYIVPEPRMAPDTSILPLVPVGDGSRTAGLLSAALDRLSSTPRLELKDLAAPVLAPCDELMDVERIAAALGTPLVETSPIPYPRTLENSLGSSTFMMGDVMWAYSFERLGFSQCRAGSPDVGNHSVEILTAPGIAWTLRDRNPIFGGEFGPVGDLGNGWSDCYLDESGGICNIAVERGDDLLIVEITGTSDLDVATEVTRTLLT